ncbi:MAG: hypothetical protein ACRDTD_07015 [Pseudonocardiaceae bacterium]
MLLTLTRRFRVVLHAGVVMVILTGAALAVAQAPVVARSISISEVSALAPSKDVCNGKSAGDVVKTYTPQAPYAAAPLRCGTSAFGFNHLKARWNSNFDESIQNTLSYAQKKEQSGSSVTFVLDELPPCPGTFRVVVEYASYGSGAKGIITAYHTSSPSTLLGEQSHRGDLAEQSPC